MEEVLAENIISPLENIEEVISSFSLQLVVVSFVILSVLSYITLINKNHSSVNKKILFFMMIGVVISVTLFLAFSTIYLNVISSSRGPVHWHADFEIWSCGRELELSDPKGWSNKVGTPILHEHNDKRIHLEGVVVNIDDASLGRFFKVIGGKLDSNSLIFPTNNGSVLLKSGDMCPDGKVAKLQVFAYRVINGTYIQQKFLNPQTYIVSPQSQVPPGDCIIIELDSEKNMTDKLCRSYKAAEQIGKIKKAGIQRKLYLK